MQDKIPKTISSGNSPRQLWELFCMTIAEALKARISIDNAHSLKMRSEILIKQVWALSMLDQVGEGPFTRDHGRSTGLARNPLRNSPRNPSRNISPKLTRKFKSRSSSRFALESSPTCAFKSPPELLFEIGLGIIFENHSERLSEIQLQTESRWSFRSSPQSLF